jgi:hypothetical protein
LLDDVTAKVSVDQASFGPLDSLDKTEIPDAVLSRELRQGLGFENTHIFFSSSINYSSQTHI